MGQATGPIDPIISPAEMHHILDSDSSQTLAVYEVRRGRNLVIQGPPGTGKSQTIANLVAATVADGKTVLFVAEKMAALEVVKRRLDATGVGAACLELHSHKANKKAVLEEIRRTWENGTPRTGDIGSLNARLGDLRDELNGHASRMHRPHATSGLTPYQVIGQLVRLRAAGEQPNDITLVAPETWSKDGFAERHGVLRELVERAVEIGTPSAHLWHGVERASVTPMEVDRLTSRLAVASGESAELEAAVAMLAAILEVPVPSNWHEAQPLLEVARRIEAAPLVPEALAAPQWAEAPTELAEVVAAGEAYAELRQTLADWLLDEAWHSDGAAAGAPLNVLPASTSAAEFETIAMLAAALPDVIDAARALAGILGEPEPILVDEIVLLARLGERMAAAPNASGAALSASIWEETPGVPEDVIAALRVYQAARTELGGKLTDAAWDIDLTAARNVLAAHGTGFFRKLSGEWRRANRLVRSCLTGPVQPLDVTLAQLDLLQKGKAALAKTVRQDAAGQAAFGGLWRGERSDVQQLGAVVQWAASLGDTGRAVRTAAAREPDREAIARLLPRLSSVVSVRQDAARLADHLGRALDSFAVSEIVETAAALTAAERATKVLFRQLPATLGEGMKLLGRLEEGRRAAQRIAEATEIGRQAFGHRWADADSRWPDLRAALRWVSGNADILYPSARIADRAGLADIAREIEERSEKLGTSVGGIASDLQLDLNIAFGSPLDHVPLASLTERLRAWSRAGESLFRWTSYRDRAQRGHALGCGDIVDRLADRRLPPERVIPAFEMAYHEALHDALIREAPELARFDGTLYEKKVADFADLDLKRIRASADETVKAHHARVPPRDGSGMVHWERCATSFRRSAATCRSGSLWSAQARRCRR